MRRINGHGDANRDDGDADDASRKDAAMERAPHARPPFSVRQLKMAIPAHCFERSLLRSSSYLAMDLLVAATLFRVASNLCTATWMEGFMAPCFWLLYWVAQGCILTGVWVIAHECGHHAFSNHAMVDDGVGLVLHSFLLVPYFSWKYSHRRHHSNTGSIDRDEVFVPKTEQRLGLMCSFTSKPLGRMVAIIVTLTLGWPSYLLFNASGRHYDRFASHFDPKSPIFNDRERTQVLLSDVCWLGVCGFLYKLASLHGIAWLIKIYAIPLLIVNGFLVLITFLQHTHPSLPHYSLDEWEWLRGALSTVDRDYGFLLNHVFHHITDTHVVHHIFSAMPHYHAKEATDAIRPILGPYYQFDATSVPVALWREFKECVFVKPDDECGSQKEKRIFWYAKKLD